MCKNYPFVIVGCIIEKNNKIVLVKENGIAKGKWNQPAGWLEKGENLIDGAKREVEEETGFKIKVIKLLGIYNLIELNKKIKDIGITINNHHAVKIIFIAELISEGRLNNYKEIQEVKWFIKEEIFAMDKELRDTNIKDEVRDYFFGISYPLEIIRHKKIE